jgi:hypothetical protein
MHMTTIENASGDRFSVHSIGLADGSKKQVFFRLSAGREETANHNPREGFQSAFAFSDQGDAERPQMDIEAVSEYIAKVSKLPEAGLVWLLAWNIAAGQWERIGMESQAAKEYITGFFGKLQGDVADLSKRSAEQLQHGLMALRIGTFEQIQSEPPFSRFAQGNMKQLLQAWMDRGEPGFLRAWDLTFHPGWEEREEQYPIRVIDAMGDCEQRALEVLSASDQQSRTAAEFWYLFYTFGESWKWERHEALGDDTGPQFSVHHIRLVSGPSRRVYFRLSW